MGCFGLFLGNFGHFLPFFWFMHKIEIAQNHGYCGRILFRTILDHFLAIFGNFLALFGHFCQFLPILHPYFIVFGQGIWCWYSWSHLDHLCNHFRPFWAIFGTFLTPFRYFWESPPPISPYFSSIFHHFFSEFGVGTPSTIWTIWVTQNGHVWVIFYHLDIFLAIFKFYHLDIFWPFLNLSWPLKPWPTSF